MKLRAAGVVALAFVMLRMVPSCTDESIVIATVPASDAGTPTAPVRCIDQADGGGCPSGTFCAKSSCSDTTGTCQLYPVYCDPTESPVCGCDQITYFNDCLRQSAGVSASIANECPFDNATPCGGDQGLACPDTTQSCAKLFGSKGACADNLSGTCWVLPATCPTPPPGADRWNSCANDLIACVDTCTAITSGGVYRRAPPCIPPPPQSP